MKIDRHTKIEDFAPFARYLADGEEERLQGIAVRDLFGPDGFYAMTIGDMLEAMGGDTTALQDDGTVFGAYRVKAFRSFVDTLIASLQRLTLPATAQQIAQGQGTLSCTFDEAVYMFCRSFFALPSYAEVDRLKVADLLLAKKEAYNAAVVERNIAERLRKGGRP